MADIVIKSYSDVKNKTGVTLAFGRSGAGHVEYCVREALKKGKTVVLVFTSLGHLNEAWGKFDVIEGVTSRDALSQSLTLIAKGGYASVVWLGYDAYKNAIVGSYGEGMTLADWGKAWKALLLDLNRAGDGYNLYATVDVVDVEVDEQVEGKKVTKVKPTVNLNTGLYNTIIPYFSSIVYVSVGATGKRKLQTDATLAAALIAGNDEFNPPPAK